MSSRFRIGFLAACAASLVGVSSLALAHHSAVSWILEKRISITGKVKVVAFRNPHGHMEVTVVDSKGASSDWSVETSAMNLLIRRGWKPGLIHVGDTVTVIGHPNKTQPNEIYMREIKLADGTSFGDPEGKDQQLD